MKKWISIILICICIIFGITSLVFLICAFCNDGCWLSKTSIAASILDASILGITIIVALNTYLQSRRVENARALLEIRKTLSSDDNKRIHKFIGNHKDKDVSEKKTNESNEAFQQFWNDEKFNIYDYLGTLELLNIYIKADIIEKDDFLQQYGYRLRNILRYSDLRNKIESQHSKYPGWTNLIELMNIVEPTYKINHLKKN